MKKVPLKFSSAEYTHTHSTRGAITLMCIPSASRIPIPPTHPTGISHRPVHLTPTQLTCSHLRSLLRLPALCSLLRRWEVLLRVVHFQTLTHTHTHSPSLPSSLPPSLAHTPLSSFHCPPRLPCFHSLLFLFYLFKHLPGIVLTLSRCLYKLGEGMGLKLFAGFVVSCQELFQTCAVHIHENNSN